MTQTEVERKWEYKLPNELDYENYNEDGQWQRVT